MSSRSAVWSADQFDDLNQLRVDLVSRRERHHRALEHFRDSVTLGYKSVIDKPDGHLSPSSTATCIRSLVEAGHWEIDPENDNVLLERLLSAELTTQGLPQGNVYTDAFIVDAVAALSQPSSEQLKSPELSTALSQRIDLIQESISNGSASIGDYPSSAYLTELATRAILACNEIPRPLGERVVQWAWDELARQLALILAGAKTADYFQLAYCAILIARVGYGVDATPQQRLLINAALEQFFEAQLPDGTWPRSQPVFDIPGVGSTYCYDYELLAQLLSEPALSSGLLQYLPSLRKSYEALTSTAYYLPNESLAWSSGHRLTTRGPESWATASAYHFIHGFERLVVEALRRHVFRYLRTPYVAPVHPSAPLSTNRPFAPDFLDARLDEHNTVRSAIRDYLAEPVRQQAPLLERGRRLTSSTPNTLILFGPPGTSKTELARSVSEYLQWPQLTIDPSHFVRNGINHINAEADRIFAMLDSLDRVVVLLDEIDELVRERTGAADPLSRFLTTSMLPKLVTLNKGKKIVFIVATNHIERFDVAISRSGRFDMILQVSPPSVEEKLARWPLLFEKLGETIENDHARAAQLLALTYAETARLVSALSEASDQRAYVELLAKSHRECTLELTTESGGRDLTWAEASAEQRSRMRIRP